MNFYNPYYYSVPTNLVQPKIGILGKLFGKTGVSIGNFINGTQRVLNIANQTIPLVKQIRPIVGNAKTMFKVMNEFKRVEKPTHFEEKDNENIDSNTHEETNYISTNEGPIFFI